MLSAYRLELPKNLQNMCLVSQVKVINIILDQENHSKLTMFALPRNTTVSVSLVLSYIIPYQIV